MYTISLSHPKHHFSLEITYSFIFPFFQKEGACDTYICSYWVSSETAQRSWCMALYLLLLLAFNRLCLMSRGNSERVFHVLWWSLQLLASDRRAHWYTPFTYFSTDMKGKIIYFTSVRLLRRERIPSKHYWSYIRSDRKYDGIRDETSQVLKLEINHISKREDRLSMPRLVW